MNIIQVESNNEITKISDHNISDQAKIFEIIIDMDFDLNIIFENETGHSELLYTGSHVDRSNALSFFFNYRKRIIKEFYTTFLSQPYITGFSIITHSETPQVDSFQRIGPDIYLRMAETADGETRILTDELYPVKSFLKQFSSVYSKIDSIHIVTSKKLCI